MTIEKEIGKRLAACRQTLATAESCSGGWIAHRITNVPGSSMYFLGGIVAYSNAAKTNLLGVSDSTIHRYGAVSEPVAREMAEGARRRFCADWGVGVTGIAGPSGGTPDKPVGTVYITLAGPGGVHTECCAFNGTRLEIKKHTAERALHMLWGRLR